MKKIFYFSFIVVAFFRSFLLTAEIVECTHFAEIFNFVTTKDCLFLEVDNILLKPQEEVAKTVFFNHLKQELLLNGYNPDQIANKLYPLWVKVQKRASTQLSDPHLKSYLQNLKNQDVKVFLLSHRGPSLAYHTLDQLHEHQLFLESLQPEFNNYEMEKKLALVYENMILLHPLCNKGEFLAKYLEIFSVNPSRVVCVDHELIHLVHIQQEMERLNIPYLGIYFREADVNISEYTKQIGQIQLEYMDQLLPDSMAQIILGDTSAYY